MKSVDLVAELEKALEWYGSDEAAASVVGVDRATIWRWRNQSRGRPVKCRRSILMAIRILRTHTKQAKQGVGFAVRKQLLEALENVYQQLTALRQQVKLLIDDHKTRRTEER
jgi:hypothetical protein